VRAYVRVRVPVCVPVCACVCVSHLEQQTGVLASLSLEEGPLPGPGPEHQAQVPGGGDGHVVLQVPPEGAVPKEPVGMGHN